MRHRLQLKRTIYATVHVFPFKKNDDRTPIQFYYLQYLDGKVNLTSRPQNIYISISYKE